MAGYNDIRLKIINTLMGRPAGTEIQPEDHQEFALDILDYIRNVELTTSSSLIGIANEYTVPIQPNDSKVSYIAGIAQNRSVVFSNFRGSDGLPIVITTRDMEALFVVLLWNTEHWTAHAFPTNIISSSEVANYYIGYTIKKTYASYAALMADVVEPVGIDGRLIRLGDVVTVINEQNPSENAFYSRIDGAWQFQMSMPSLPVQTRFTELLDVKDIVATDKEYWGFDGTNWKNRQIQTSHISDFQQALNNWLGKPTQDGYLLSSLANGTRSWVAPYSHPDYSIETGIGGTLGHIKASKMAQIDTLLSLFERKGAGTEVDPYKIEAKHHLYSLGGVSAFGWESSGSAPDSLDVLINWEDYSEEKELWALSAKLGKSLLDGKKDDFADDYYSKPGHKHTINDISNFSPYSHPDYSVAPYTDGTLGHITTATLNSLKTLLDWFEWDAVNEAVKVKHTFYSTGGLSAFGVGDVGSGGGGVDVLIDWSTYDSSKENWALSAKLGVGLNTSLAGKQDAILPGTYAAYNHNHSIANILDYVPYTHPSHTSRSVGGTRNFIKTFTSDALGHITGITTEAMAKSDIELLLTGDEITSHYHDSRYHKKNELFELKGSGTTEDPFVIEAKYTLYSLKGLSAFGLGNVGSGGAIFDRLDNWIDYDVDKATWVLSAKLGNELYTSVQSLSSVSHTHSNYSLLNSLTSSDITRWDGKENASNKNIAGGYAGLDSSGKLYFSQFPDVILGQLKYGGTINSSKIITSEYVDLNGISAEGLSATLYKGYYFIAQANITVNGVVLNTGDWFLSNGAAGWTKVDNTDAISLVNGKTGNVTLYTDDISETGSPVNKWFTEARVRSSLLTGYSVGSNSAISATDSVLSSLGKIQGQINARALAVGSYSYSGFKVGSLDVNGTSLTKSELDFIKQITALFEWDGINSAIKALYTLYSVGGLSSFGLGDVGSGGGTSSVITVDHFNDISYDPNRALSSYAGARLNTSLSNKQPLNAQLTALSGLSGNGLIRKIGTSSYTVDSTTYEPIFTKNTAFNKNFGTSAGTVAEGNHTHTFASLTSKPTTISGYGIGMEGVSWNTALTNNTIGFLSGATDSPTSGTHFGIGMYLNGNPAYSGVFIVRNNRAFFQTKEGGTLQGWNEFYHSGNSNSSSVPWAASVFTEGGTALASKYAAKSTTLSGYGISSTDTLFDSKYVFQQNAINTDATKTFPTGIGITLGNHSTESTGFPNLTGSYVDFSTVGGNSGTTWRRDFTIWKWYGEERWYLRGYSGTDGSPLTWREIWHSGNLLDIGTTASSARDALGLGSMALETASNYLPLSGGTLTDNGFILKKAVVGSSWARHILRFEDSTASIQAGLGAYGASDSISYMYLGFNAYNSDNLRVYSDKVQFGNSLIYHSGNSNLISVDWSAKNLTLAGTLSGATTITATSTIQATTAKLTNLTDGYIPYHISNGSGLGNSLLYQTGSFIGLGSTTTRARIEITYSSSSLPSIDSIGAIIKRGNATSDAFGAGMALLAYQDKGFLISGGGTNFTIHGYDGSVASSRFFEIQRANGNVGIGYTNDQGYKLAVNGSGYFNATLGAANVIQSGAQLGQYATGRAELSMISITDLPCDFWLGNNSERKWSIGSRSSTEGNVLSFFSANGGGHLMRLWHSGKLGLGYTTEQSTTLAVNGSGYFATTLQAGTSITAPTITASTELKIGAGWSAIQNGTDLELKYSTNKVSITNNGTIYAPGFIHSSDIRLKNVVRPLENVLDKIRNFSTFLYTEKSRLDLGLQLGMSAQDFEFYFPTIVSKDKFGYLGLQYPRISVIAIKAIQELDSKQSQQEGRIVELEREVKTLKEKLYGSVNN